MVNNNEDDHGLEEFIKYAEEVVGVKLADWQRDMLAAMYNRYGALEVHAYVDKDDREYDKVDDELSDLVDEFLSSPAKGEQVSLDLGDLTATVRKAIGEAGYSVNATTSLDMAEYMKDMACQLSEAVDADVVKNLDDHTLGRLVDLVNDEWSSRGYLTPKDTEHLNAPQYGKGGEANATARAYAGSHGAYLSSLLANGFTRDEAMAMVMFELNADLARDIHRRG